MDDIDLLYFYIVEDIALNKFTRQYGVSRDVDVSRAAVKPNGFNRVSAGTRGAGVDKGAYKWLKTRLGLSEATIKEYLRCYLEYYRSFPDSLKDRTLTFEEYLARVNITKNGNNQVAEGSFPAHYESPRMEKSYPMSYPQPQIEETKPSGKSFSTKNVRIASIAGTCFFILMMVSVFVVPRVSDFLGQMQKRGPLNKKNAVVEMQAFTPVLLSGLSVGIMFDGASPDGVWSTYEDSNKTTWVRFSGSSERGPILATFTLTNDRKLEYTCFVDGEPVPLDELYNMFHDPEYDKKIEEALAEAENEANFNESQEKISKMALVHDYSLDDFNGMTILEFVEAVCTGGEWSSNDKAEAIRVIYDGSFDNGTVQAIFDVDLTTETVVGTWYYQSKEISAADLYMKFYGE